jgi:N-methylhydantoinase A
MGSFRVGVDIGGTFTDVVLLGTDGSLRTTKVLSTPADYAEGVVAGVRRLQRDAEVSPTDISGVVHATTVASNAVLERRGATVALVTTEGFRDVLEMRRLRIPVLYDLQYEKPEPLVPRALRFEVRERLGPRGEVWAALDESTVRDVAARLSEQRVEAVAIALLHSYADDAHERRVEEILRENVPDDVFITRSADILPEIREYERTSTAVVNAYLGPTVGRYIDSLTNRLRDAEIDAPLEIMQSSGGTLPPAIAARKPAHLVESGPAAGVIACSQLGRLTGRPNLISLDMGGTTAKAALVEDGLPARTSEYEVGAGINLSSRLVKGGGHAIKLPFIDVSEIGAGGGSIVEVDPQGVVRVGPESAGSDPGPACYGRGGTSATLTDALVVLGHLNPGQLVGGDVLLDAPAARNAITEQVAIPLGTSPVEAAHGVLTIAVATMMRAVKAVTTYRGRDPRDFAICAFGGNGPLVAVELARALQVRTVVVPPSPGVFSALGLLFGESERELVRTVLLRSDELDAETVESALTSLERDALAQLADEGHPAGRIDLERFADLRYAGQAYELPVPVPPGRIAIDRLLDDFVAEHERTYGHGSRHDPIELVSVRLVARVPRADPASYDPLPEIAARSREVGERDAYFGTRHGTLATPVVTRASLLGSERRGPFLVDEYDSTIVVPPGCSARVDGFGNVEVTVHDG